MKINDEIRRGFYFEEAKEGEIFRYYSDGGASGPYYCIKTETYYEDGEIVFNAVNLETGELFYVEEDEEIIIATAELTVK